MVVFEPGQGIGIFRLRMTEAELTDAAGEPEATGGRGGIAFHEYGHITVSIWEGTVNMVIAGLGLAESTRDGVSPGCSWGDLLAKVGPVEYDEEAGLWFAPAAAGIWYEVVRPAKDHEEPLDPPFVPELYSVSDPDAFVRRIYVMTDDE